MKKNKVVNITIKSYKRISDISIALSHIYLLELSYFGEYEKIKELSEIFKIKGYLQTLIRKEYLTESYTLTVAGEELYKSVLEDKETTSVVTRGKSQLDMFEEWWNAYPKTTQWSQGNKTFHGDRALRLKKVACKEKYIKILSEGVTHESMMGALDAEVKLKKESSLKSGENKLQYMKSTESYLNARVFESFIDVKVESKGGGDSVHNL